YGVEAPRVVAEACGDPELLEPLAPHIETTRAELLFAVNHEGALDAADLLDRRTRIGLVPAEAEIARPAVEEVLSVLTPPAPHPL
ncbi:MAG: glycerol-3-phosphate dehydrogenase C-terminal domain-containing protein, partial [Nocardioidaceae bacterium]